MKKFFLFAFVAAVALGLGCAITNYSLITDNDQGGVVNTNGKAYIRQSSQVATTWPDSNDNLIWFVDQAANGDRNLTTYNFNTSLSASPFKDDLYCSPDWNGCAIVTAPDPETGDVDMFDYRGNANCSGYRSLSLLVSTSRYYGECGRTATTDRTTKMLNLANNMTPIQINGQTWLHSSLSALNTSIVLNNNNGSAFALPMTSQIGVSANFATRRVMLDMTNPNNRNLIQSALNWNRTHPGSFISSTVTVDGTAFNASLKVKNDGTASHY